MGGLVSYTRPPEFSHLEAPAFRTPFTDITAVVGHHDGDPECLPFQLRWVDCAEAYGRELSKTKCKYHYQDFIECAKQWKQQARLADMHMQRYHRWLKGVLGNGPKFPLYGETPRYDGFVPTFLYWDVHHE